MVHHYISWKHHFSFSNLQFLHQQSPVSQILEETIDAGDIERLVTPAHTSWFQNPEILTMRQAVPVTHIEYTLHLENMCHTLKSIPKKSAFITESSNGQSTLLIGKILQGKSSEFCKSEHIVVFLHCCKVRSDTCT